MEREDALARIQSLVGKDLRPLAEQHGVTVWQGEKLNKGWVGHTMERFLGLPLNSAQSPNFGSWELKVIPVVRRIRRARDGYRIKETMAITMIDCVEVKSTKFEDSHLLRKLRKLVVVARTFEDPSESHAYLHAASHFDLDDPETYRLVKADYDEVQSVICTQGFDALSGSMGKLVQPRTKGMGHGSTTRAFYARTGFVAHIIWGTPLTP